MTEKIKIPEILFSKVKAVETHYGEQINQLARARDQRITDLLDYFINSQNFGEGARFELDDDLSAITITYPDNE